MKKILRMELKKAFWNRWFFFSLTLGLIAAGLSCYDKLSAFFREMDYLKENLDVILKVDDPVYSGYTVYNHWIGSSGESLGARLFYFWIPLLASISYGWSYAEEHFLGYDKQIVMRAGRGAYRHAKRIAIFLTGSCTAILPQIFNIIVILCFVPVRTPMSYLNTMYPVYPGFLSRIYFTVPALYVAFFVLYSGVFCGLTAIFCMEAVSFGKKGKMAVLIPFVILMLLDQFLPLLLQNDPEKPHVLIRPFSMMTGSIQAYTLGVVPIVLWITAMAALIFVLERWKKKEELY